MSGEIDESCSRGGFLLIRHGQIQANLDGRWHGSTDSPLTDTGRDQARRLGDYFARSGIRIDAIYASPLQRTTETARTLGEAIGIAPVPCPELVEYSLGELEDTHYKELVSSGFFKKVAADPDHRPPGGESVRDVEGRVRAVLDRIWRDHGGGLVALVGHGATFGILLSSLLRGAPLPFFDYHQSNTGFSHLSWIPEPALLYFNRTDHLE